MPAPPPTSSFPAGFSAPTGAGDSIYPALGDAGLDVTHYDLSIRSDPRLDTLSGRALLNVVARSTLSQIALDFAGPITSRVLLDGQAARFLQVGEKLLILPSAPLKAGTRFTLDMTYQGTPALHLDPDLGLRLGWITQDDASYTLSEPGAAHTYFPCNDLPADGASFTLHLDVPAGYTAVASGVQTGQRSLNGRTITDFDLPQETATYALGIQVGRLDVVTRPNEGDVALRDAFPVATPRASRLRLPAPPKCCACWRGGSGRTRSRPTAWRSHTIRSFRRWKPPRSAPFRPANRAKRWRCTSWPTSGSETACGWATGQTCG